MCKVIGVTTRPTPVVTVLMPVYNGSEYLNESIRSILQQSFTDFEFIIIDDGSTDDSVSIVSSFKDYRIRLICNDRNLGVSEALNKGLALSSGMYVARMDSDDISYPERLAKQVAFMEENREIGICGTWVEVIGGSEAKVYRYPTDSWRIKCNHLFGPALAHPSVIMRREWLERLGNVYNSNFNYAQDYELWVRASEFTRIANIGEILLKYRLHPNQIGQERKDEQNTAADSVRLLQIRNLGIMPTTDEETIHNSISQWRFEPSRDFVERTELWFCRLLDANRSSSVYPEPFFSSLLYERWFEVCDFATELGPWLLKKFCLSPLKPVCDLPWNRCSRFFINCLLARKRGRWFRC